MNQRIDFVLFVAAAGLLMYIGACPAEEPFIGVAGVALYSIL